MPDSPTTALPTSQQRPRRWPRLLGILGLICLGLGGALIGFLPEILSSSEGNRVLLGQMNQAFAPGRLQVEKIHFSWTRPTTLTNLVLNDSAGEPVLTAPKGALNRSLWSLISRPKDLGTLLIDQLRIELDRRPDGTINLVEALGRVFDRPDPNRDLTISLAGGLTFRDQSLREPFLADDFAFRLHIQRAPAPVVWELRMSEPKPGSAAVISAEGDFDRWRQRSNSGELPDLGMKLSSSGWPVVEDIRGTIVATNASGSLAVRRVAGRWESDGDLALDVQNLQPPDPDGLFPRKAVVGWKSWTVGELQKLSGRVSVDRIAQMDQPVEAEFAGSYEPSADAVELEALSVATDWVRVEAAGRLEALSGSRTADLRGTILPDYRKLSETLAARLEPNARIAGSPAPWTLKGSLSNIDSSTRPRDLTVTLGFSIDEADLYGMKLGSTKFEGRLADGKLVINSIQSRLNGGELLLNPVVDLDAPGGPVVRLDSGSSLRDALINDEVSGRVLSYVAPVLNQATQVNGRVSADLTSAEFPIARGVGRKAKVEGLVVFRDVTFAAGPLSKELLALVIRDPAKLDTARLVLDQPVHLSIDEGRVTQKGLGLPIGKLARIELDGWVDFDRKLGMEATIPLNPELFPNAPLLQGVARATRVRIPISGTLDKPLVDGSAMKANLAEMGRDVLMETGVQGIAQIFSRLNRPKDPNAPPPPPKMTAEERKAQRLEKKAERQKRRNTPK